MFSLIPRRARRELARTEPFEWFRREFGPLFDRAHMAWPTALEVPLEFRWGLEMEEAEKEYVIRAEMPGFEMNEIEVNLTGNVLAIRAVHPVPEGKEGTSNRLERSVTVPEDVNPEGVTASYRNGLLEVHLPRTPAPTGRRIEVKA